MMTNLLIIGAGGHGKVVADCAIEQGDWERIAFLDDLYPGLTEVLGCPVLGKLSDAEQFVNEYPDAVIAVGNNQRRIELLATVRGLGFGLSVICHPSAVISRTAVIGPGSVLFANSVVNTDARLGDGCIVNTGATIDHDCVLADGVHISPGAHLGGAVLVGRASWVGIGACVRELTVIGGRVLVGAGAAVVGDVPDGVTVTGVPAEIAQTVERVMGMATV